MDRKQLTTAVLVLVGLAVGFILGGWNHRQEYVSRMLELKEREDEIEQREKGLEAEVNKMRKQIDDDIAKMDEWMEFFGRDEMAAFEDYVKMRPIRDGQSKEDYIKQFKEYRKWLESR